ncbi:MAG: VWA domain-containing protein [Thermoanaerobaculia bacterium]|nr:VWA domain-containing protein [Thermoanaerobaculia bacterium]
MIAGTSVDKRQDIARAIVQLQGGTSRDGLAALALFIAVLLPIGAIVAVISDGWDRGDLGELDREIARLARSCERLIWLNPLLGSPGYQPLSQGIQTVLPYVDDFLPVHNLESLAQLAAVLARLERRGSLGITAIRKGNLDARRSA